MGAEPSHPPLRSDARHNRERILRVAATLFAERGLDVPMAAIARHAGVGVATLYRRFPTKDSLVTEVFTEQFATCARVLEVALADPDPWRGFRTVVVEICAMQVADRGFGTAFLAALPDAVDVERERALADLAGLIARAQAAGALRADFVPADLLLVLAANNGLVTGSAETTRVASRRLVAYLLNSFRADHADPAAPLPPPAPLTVHDVR
ncbi:helix-turn-helix domain-containing protein [Actinosynnema sp. NPDC047251]|uniref:Transcriptional regulator, TetR family n=1 Tax=Saccharothrix espanaensis (strain ATCC 51144 / DSM 44229 / JCM 9112 / NBRC 15066 / NRRL 15764) TaxID=1179773 RepID=K0KB12_SACES|nr:TetR/AcrR family transcriptional regulator [Saccharothrix espanaensis]CCH34004.1 Transcriptional regulator, TetR family [Saccharothrix espanaensis DSM 44229]